MRHAVSLDVSAALDNFEQSSITTRKNLHVAISHLREQSQDVHRDYSQWATRQK